ncbi:hypothetical protein MTR_1g043380 [Medicago truncatula]|uniref:Uncharacterized protein n=1 Tax=Medicago truncatula TaxID=3880 RepID=G7I5E2_MEDTR|nr:hypothetical protein MTR_1g043380 [Medicago truncatula]
MEKGSSSSSATVIRSVASGKQTENNIFKFRRGGDVCNALFELFDLFNYLIESRIF